MTTKEHAYSESEIAERLTEELPRWRYENGWIRRRYKTHSWKGTLMVINAVGHLPQIVGNSIFGRLKPSLEESGPRARLTL